MLTSLSEQSRHDFYSSTSSRATFTDLPPETLEQITRCLCNSRKQHFDTIAIQDLQNLRLTSRALCLVATPVLFENLVFDEKFLEPQQLSRIIDFAAQNPDLAKWVRRLQHKVAPILLQDAPGILGTTAAAEICAESGTTPQLMESKERYCKESDINTLLLDPIRRWVWNALARKHRQLPGIIGLGQLPTSENEEATYEKYHPAFLHTISALPNLTHIEIVHSNHFQDHVDDVISHLNGKYRITIQLPTIVDESVLIQAVSIAAGRSHEFMHPGIASLKLVGQCLNFNPQASKNLRTLSHLTHLDLEYCVGTNMTSGQLWATDWLIWTADLKKYPRTLINLRGLRLSCHPGFHPMDLMDAQSYPLWIFGSVSAAEQYYFDAALSNCVWPHLRSLSLVRWPMRRAGLENIITSHATTLRELELDRISVLREKSFANDQSAWLPVAESCAGCKELRYLQITKPRVHHWCLWDPSKTKQVIIDEHGLHGDSNGDLFATGVPYINLVDIYQAAGHLAPKHSEIDPFFD